MHQRRLARAAAGSVRRSLTFDVNRLLMAVWAVLVLVFMFIPIGLVFRHSFNGGSSFSIWSGETSTKWWGELFDGGAAWAVLVRFVALADADGESLDERVAAILARKAAMIREVLAP